MSTSASSPPTRTIYILPAGTAVPSQQKPTLYRPVKVARVANVNVLRPSPPSATSTHIQLLPPSPSMHSATPSPTQNSPQTKNLKRSLMIDDINDLIDHHCSSSSSVPRKRERLTHLSRDEKQQRRKLKNREAAQTARDRKKDRTSKLEEALLNAVAESREKSEIISQQRVENDRLKEELAAVRQQLQHSSVAQMPPTQQLDVNVQNSSGTPTGPAAFANPQPRDGVLMPLALMFTAVATLVTLCRESATTSSPKPSKTTSGHGRTCAPSTRRASIPPPAFLPLRRRRSTRNPIRRSSNSIT